MAQVTGTLAWMNGFLADEPADMSMLLIQVAGIAVAISTVTDDLAAKTKQAPGGVIDGKAEDEALARLEPLNRELQRLLEIKNRMEARNR